jgi:hypothetical protein
VWRSALGPHAGCILADDMGLGKSLQVITACYAIMAIAKTCRKLLLVCPASLCTHWQAEWSKWVGPHRVSVCTDTSSASVAGWLHSPHASALICSYEAYRDSVSDTVGRMLRGEGASEKELKKQAKEQERMRKADMKELEKKRRKLIAQGLTKEAEEEHAAMLAMANPTVTPAVTPKARALAVRVGLVCDEAHRLKSDSNKTFQSMLAIPFSYRVLLTGTPVQNNLAEYHALLSLAAPTLLPPLTTFRSLYMTPIGRAADAQASAAQKALGSARARQLTALTKTVVLRRGREVLKGWVPPREVIGVVCGQSEEMERVKAVVDRVRKAGGDSIQAVGLLRKCALHPLMCVGARKVRYDDEGEEAGGGTAAASNKHAYSAPASGAGAGTALLASAVPRTAAPATAAAQRVIDTYYAAPPAPKKKSKKKSSLDEDVDVEDDDDDTPSVFMSALSTACPRVVPRLQDSPKLMLLYAIVARMRRANAALPAAEQTKVVVVSSYTAALDIAASVVQEVYRREAPSSSSFMPLRLDGSCNSASRAQTVTRFQSDGPANDNSWVLLLSAGAGGVGLNLTRASVMVLLDCHWNGAVDEQAMGRVWRAGQKRESVVIRLLTAASVDEVAWVRQRHKRVVAGLALGSKAGGGVKDDDVRAVFALGKVKSHAYATVRNAQRGDEKGKNKKASVSAGAGTGVGAVAEEDGAMGGYDWRWGAGPGPLLEGAGGVVCSFRRRDDGEDEDAEKEEEEEEADAAFEAATTAYPLPNTNLDAGVSGGAVGRMLYEDEGEEVFDAPSRKRGRVIESESESEAGDETSDSEAGSESYDESDED